ncbi:hypothetical protein BDR07DRAFT_1418602 [Suillus spraguei]|nr:hypothetical protein BDR07DRAFT_1418602 [Suillus spraguei]
MTQGYNTACSYYVPYDTFFSTAHYYFKALIQLLPVHPRSWYAAFIYYMLPSVRIMYSLPTFISSRDHQYPGRHDTPSFASPLFVLWCPRHAPWFAPRFFHDVPG